MTEQGVKECRDNGMKEWGFVSVLAQPKARQAPPLLQTSLAAALISRWTAMLSRAAMHAFAACLLAEIAPALPQPSSRPSTPPRHEPQPPPSPLLTSPGSLETDHWNSPGEGQRRGKKMKDYSTGH